MTERRALACALSLAPLASAVGALASGDGGDAHASRLAETRELYGSEGWPAGARRAGYDLSTLVLDGFEGGAVSGLSGLVTRRFRALDPRGGGVVVELTVGDTAADAGEQLVSWLASVSSAGRVPRADELGVTVGELGFAGRSRHGDDHPAWIAFVRGNVALRVVAADLRTKPRVRLGAVARALDLGVSAGRELKPDEPVERPRITRLACERTRAVAGAVLGLDVAVADPGGGRAHLAWHLTGTATGYVEQDERGAWRLHTTGPGRLELTVEALGSTGTFARRAVALVLEDD
ncbi:MAG: hypothetical protein QF903_08850 [Planctomycetota bacterium]|nr:hypothetical protein [Planctomycetota bacterium]MDP6763785.1 hypothetical protein [Planctomycetota bacterium]MDP6989572.1 hypothetical protein [Planctomycetota bacterium]